MPLTPSGRRTAAVLLVGATAVSAVVGARWVAEQLAPVECVFVAADREETFTPEQSANAATIAAVGLQRGLPPRAATIALATAIQESKLRNLRYGDADSQGLFQQRPSQGWGTVEQVTDPVYASNAFYAALEQVPGWQDGVVTEVAQEVQRSAFPEAYADHEQEGRVLASVLTGQEGASTRMGCRLHQPAGPGSAQALADKLAEQLGVTGSVDAGAGSLTLELEDEALAWSAGTWAVSHAEAEEVVAVTVGSRSWDRGADDPLSWVDAGSALPSTTVLVEVAG
ncbi:hypothetical protein [Ornithinimicrobium cerasi]|uniref:Heavy metal transporter n=1 Tax=Ornithinimicrobium cerasi TaxID=2248773 RepID=A0A285VSU9_9MICO|nr:hypothetical protein [Ornithinimicrobium cerasi]SOC55691.1 hypothetical protein SAMN05421879_105211 [Ornithinimicrobium cerasi]